MKNIKSALRNGEIVIGATCYTSHPSVIEIFGYAGWDYVLINSENSSISPYGFDLENLIRAADVAGVNAIIKVTDTEPAMIRKALDFGATAVMVSCRNKEDCIAAMKATQYPPKGIRQADDCLRVEKYGAISWSSYLKQVDEEIFIVPLLESKEAMDNLEEILSVEDLDLVTIGPFDLAIDLGGVGDPAIEGQIKDYWGKMLGICQEKGISVMKTAHDVASVKEAILMGYRCIIFPPACDIEVLNNVENHWVKELRKAIKEINLK